MMEEQFVEERKTKIKKKLFGWVQDNYDKLFLVILILAFIIRFIIFLKTMNQPLWWDEGDYLATAKRWGLGLNIRDMWYYRRGFFWPFFSAFFFWVGLGEIGIRFTEVLFSTGIIAISYFLIKEMFDKKKAILVSVLVTFSWIFFFFTGRVLTEIPSTLFLLLSLLFFWKGYILKKGNKFLYLFGLFFALAVLTRMQLLMSAPAFLFIIFVKEKFKFIKNKNLWIAFGIFAVLILPHIIMYWSHYGNPITDIMGHYFGVKGISETGAYTQRTASTLFSYLKDLPYILGGQLAFGKVLFFMFLIGVFYFFLDLIIGFDKIFTDEVVQKKLFIFLWVVIPLLVLGYITQYVEQRYTMPVLPFLFLIALYPLSKLEDLLMKNRRLSRKFLFVLIFAIIILILIPNIKWGNQLTEIKKTSYFEIMQAGLWIKANSNPEDIIISQSYPQITYYAERTTYSPNFKQKDIGGFEELIKEQKPKYYMLSTIERSEDWTYIYPQSHNDTLIPVWIYPPNSQQPSVIIYEFNY